VGEAPVLEAITVEEPAASAGDTGFSAATPPAQSEPKPAVPTPKPAAPTPAPAEPPKQLPDSEVDLVIACPDCGKVINVDMFEYPNKVYSEMGAARLNHARICIVQGKNDEAMKAVRMARAMYEKADDKKGLKEVLKLVESLAKG
jgi:pyruvate/2-oxoglutarate dehydrogenase complex dihydrolipoamide acyltransferase (E2) component